jgi:hypothetical protein
VSEIRRELPHADDTLISKRNVGLLRRTGDRAALPLADNLSPEVQSKRRSDIRVTNRYGDKRNDEKWKQTRQQFSTVLLDAKR